MTPDLHISQPEALRSARRRRADLHHALVELEGALATPAGSADWRDGVTTAVAGLRRALVDHVAEVESPEGLLARLLDDAPRLAHAVDKIREDHVALTRAVAELDDLAGNREPADVRAAAVDVLADLSRHRHRGADLVYEAYVVDIGTGD